MSRRFGCCLVGSLLLLGISRHAHAADAAAAEALFAQGKKLAAAGKFAEACPKFAESNRLDRAAGTLIHLGNCYEKNHQTASAWATFKEAASAADALGRKDWAKIATKRANALEPKLAHLTIKVDAANEKLDVTRDGTSVSSAAFGVALPVDIGPHTVEASASGRRPFKATVTVAKDGVNVEVLVPILEREPEPVAIPTPAPVAAPAPAPVTAAAPPPPPSGGGRRTLGFVVAGVGVAGLAVGAVTGLMAMNENSTAQEKCGANDGACASHEGVDAADHAKTFGLVSTIGFVAGGVGLAAGAALVLTAPREREGRERTARVRVTPLASPTGGGLTVGGAF